MTKTSNQTQESDRYKTLLEIGHSLSAITDLHQLLAKISEAVTRNMHAEHVLVILRHEVTGDLRIEHSNVNIDSSTQRDALQFSRTVVNDVVNKGKSILSRDVIRDGSITKSESVTKMQIRSLMCVPLTSRQNSEITGTLYADNRSAKNAFKQDDLKLLESFANMAAIAIENAHLYEQTILDELTQCYVRRYFDQRLEVELARSIRQSSSLSLLFIDVDSFKNINDHHGHDAGDAVLKGIAILMKRNLRAYDLLARLGGDEFAVLLPETSASDASKVAEKIRSGVLQMEIPEAPVRITVSIGVAACPEHDQESVDSLEKKADVALYRAKQYGRNSVQVYYEEKEGASDESVMLIRKTFQILTELQDQLIRIDQLSEQAFSHVEKIDPSSTRSAEALTLLRSIQERLKRITARFDG
jgi:diguanylate cyclase (GGDEF)-like protein